MKDVLAQNKLALVRLALFLFTLAVLALTYYKVYGLDKKLRDVDFKVGVVNKAQVQLKSEVELLKVTPSATIAPTLKLKK